MKKVDKTGRVILNRAGYKLRSQHSKYRAIAKQNYYCENCGNIALIRKYAGLWICKICDSTIVGNSYTPYLI